MRTASGGRCPIEGYGDLPLNFRYSSGDVHLLLRDVAHVPSLSYHVLSLRVVADYGRCRVFHHRVYFSSLLEAELPVRLQTRHARPCD